MPKKYPDAAKVKIDDGWRRDVKKVLDERPMSQAELAKLVGTSQPAISQLLTAGRGPKTSSLALAVAKITGVPVPGYEDDAEIALFARAAKKLRNRDPHAFSRYEQGLRRALERLDQLDDETLNTISSIDVNISREPQDGSEGRRSRAGGSRTRKK